MFSLKNFTFGFYQISRLQALKNESSTLVTQVMAPAYKNIPNDMLTGMSNARVAAVITSHCIYTTNNIHYVVVPTIIISQSTAFCTTARE